MAAAAMTPEKLVDFFLTTYTQKFVGNRAELAALYEDASSYSFEGKTVAGKASIAKALAALPIPAGSKIRRITTNIQNAPSKGAFLVMITGEVVGSKYQQVFQLVPRAGGYYIHNDIFRAGVSNPDNAPAAAAGDVMKPFVTTYYQLFDSDRSKLAVVYSAASTFSFEKTTKVGQKEILAYLATLPGTKHAIKTMDVQTVSGADKKVLLVFVTGDVTIEGSENPLKFCQTFQMIHNGTTYYVHNDIFRLNYG